MAITAGVCNSFKLEVMEGTHDIMGDTFMIALYTSTATLSPSTTAYTATGESSGAGYVAGGQILTGANIKLDDDTAVVTFSDVTWTGSTIDAAGALIYNSDKSNRAVVVLDFNGTKSSTNGDFSVIMPAFDKLNALIQLK